MHIRQSRRHLDDDGLRALYCRAMPHIRGAEIEEAVFVRWTGFQHQNIDRVDEAAIIVRHLAEIERRVMTTAGIVLVPVIAAEMPAERMKMAAFRIGLQKGTRLD